MKRLLIMIIVTMLILPTVVLAEDGLRPYTEHNLPCTILGADFDYGGEGVAFSALTGERQGMYNYRNDAELNFYADNDVTMGCSAGAWTKYTVNAAKSGVYRVYVGYAAPQGGNVNIIIDDRITLSGDLKITGGWQDISRIDIGTVSLTAGTHVVKFMVGSSPITFKDIVFETEDTDRIITDFSRKDGVYRNAYIPCVIQAEDYDMGAGGCKSVDGINNGKEYRENEPIDILNKDGKYIVKLAKSEWTKYTFIVENSGAYKISAAANGSASLYFDDAVNGVAFQSSDIDAEADIVSVWLSKGEHSVKVCAESDINIDYIRFQTTKDYITLDSIGESKEPVKQWEREDIYKDFYVSPYGNDSSNGTKEEPFKTIEAARDAVRKCVDEMTGDIVVHIMPGDYKIDKTIEFDERDGGNNGFNVIYKGESVLDPPVINAGTKIDGWVKSDEHIWKAAAPIECTRTLYVNDIPAQRARSKYVYDPIEFYSNENSEYVYDGIKASATNFPTNLTNPDDLELVWDITFTCQRMPVQDLKLEKNTINFTMKQPAFQHMMTKAYKPTCPSMENHFYIENAKELLDEPGEFYFDKKEKMIYYYPYEEEDLQTADVYVGTTDFMVSAKGSSLENKLTNIIFDNIEFKYGSWNDVSDEGIVGVQADKIQLGEYDDTNSGGRLLPAQFTVENAQNVFIKNCKFKCLGSGGISMANGVQNSGIIGNVFTDISGSAIVIGHWDHAIKIPDGMERCVNIEVANNVIRRVACEFRGCCGISAYYVNNVRIHNNDIKNVPYTGITLGWGWGTDVKECADNSIYNNRIEDVTSITTDGAHIYTLGPMRNTDITGNYLIKAGDYRGGIYLDEGTGYVKVNNNVIEQSKVWLNARPNVNLKEITAENNFTDTDGTDLDQNNVTVTGTTVVPDRNWNDAAKAIIENAGLENGYERLLTGVELPKWKTNIIYNTPTHYFDAHINNWIQAEAYNEGGEGVGYHKLDGGKVVTYESGFNNYVVGDTKPDEWLAYDISIRDSSKYMLQLKVANNFPVDQPQPRVNIYLDGEKILQDVSIPNTGSWTVHSIENLGQFDIPAGKHTVKIEFSNNGFSFDSWRFFCEDAKNDEDYDEGIILAKETEIFSDIAGHWAEEKIDEMYKAGIVKGVGENRFEPDANVSLYQAVWLAMRAAKMDYNEDDWMSIAASNGLLYNEHERDRSLERQRFAEIVMEVYEYKKGNYTLVWDESAYNDFSQIATDKVNAVLGAKNMKLMIGDTDGNFRPESTLTRAEAVTVVAALMKLF